MNTELIDSLIAEAERHVQYEGDYWTKVIHFLSSTIRHVPREEWVRQLTRKQWNWLHEIRSELGT